jgi:hypothetical protein
MLTRKNKKMKKRYEILYLKRCRCCSTKKKPTERKAQSNHPDKTPETNPEEKIQSRRRRHEIYQVIQIKKQSMINTVIASLMAEVNTAWNEHGRYFQPVWRYFGSALAVVDLAGGGGGQRRTKEATFFARAN